MVEDDYLDRANIDVIKGQIGLIDVHSKQLTVKGVKQPIKFDKILIAWGANKKRLGKDFSNVFYLEDRQSHARCHNEIIKAKTIVIMGGTFEAYQVASSVREYLDSIGYTDTEIILIDNGTSEVQQSFGLQVSEAIHQMLKDMRISVLMKAEITNLQGEQKLEKICFQKRGEVKAERNVEFFIRPDVVIAENGIGDPKYNLSQVLAPVPDGKDFATKVEMDPSGIPSANVKFSLDHNDIHSPIFTAGSCANFPSFIHKQKIRTCDFRYNVESGFFAAMQMMDKRSEFRYLPFMPMKINGTPVYFVGERNQPFHEVIINGSVEDKKFVAYFVYGGEVTGFLTCGFQNLHLYLWEAMKLLIMPPATQLASHSVDYRTISKKVLQMRPYIQCKRHDIIKIPSIMLAEFEGELDYQLQLRQRLKQNVQIENEKQKVKFMQMKAKYDREGVEFVQDEMELADKEGGTVTQGHQTQKAQTIHGGRKPGQTSSGQQFFNRENINMGADNDNMKNPFSAVINMAKKSFNG